MNDRYLRGIYLRLAAILVLVVTMALLANAALSHRMFGLPWHHKWPRRWPASAPRFEPWLSSGRTTVSS